MAQTIEFREDTRYPLVASPQGSEVGGIIIRALVGGVFAVRFACSPGTVTPPDPGTVTPIDPAPSFATTLIQTPPPVDDPPNADAGADQTVNEGALVTLDGSASSDPNGEALTYAWTAPAGITLTGADTANPTFTAPQVTANTPFAFVLQVCDQANPDVLCDTDTVVVNVLDVPVPTISINDPAAVTEGGAVTFTVSLSSAAAGTVTVDYATSDGTATAPGDYTAATGTVTFAPGDTSETVVVQTIDDTDFAEADTETFNVTLSNVTGNATIGDATGVGTINDNDVAPPVDDPPTAAAGPDQTVDSGQTVTLAGSGTDPENETLTFAWTQTAGTAVTLSDPTSPTPTFTAPTGPQTLTFELEVCDAPDPDSLCDTDTVDINVRAPAMPDAATEVIVNGPVGPSTRKTSKSFVIKVSNDGTSPLTIDPSDVTSSVTVNGTVTGTVSVAGLPVTLSPGSSKRLKATWSYTQGAFPAGASIAFTSCVNDPADVDTSNNCDTATVTAK